MMIIAYDYGMNVLLRYNLSVNIKNRIVAKPITIVHYRLLGNVSIECISAAEQAVRTMKLDRETSSLKPEAFMHDDFSCP